MDFKVTRCSGEGQGSCTRCTYLGKYNRTWMCFLSNIEGLSGCYCSDCVSDIRNFVTFIFTVAGDSHE